MCKIKRSVFTTAHLPLCFQKIKRSATKSILMHSAEFGLAQYCFVAKGMSCYLYFFCLHCCAINIHIFDHPDSRLSGLFTEVPTSPDNRGSTVHTFTIHSFNFFITRRIRWPFKISVHSYSCFALFSSCPTCSASPLVVYRSLCTS